MVRRVLELKDGFLQCSNVPMVGLSGEGLLVSNFGELAYGFGPEVNSFLNTKQGRGWIP